MFRDGLRLAWELIVGGDPLVWGAAMRSLWISSLAVALAALVALPVGIALAESRLPGTRLLVLLLRGAMALPTVFLGTVCYGIFSRQGPLGTLEVLYTPWAIVAGEFLLAAPIVASLSHGAVVSLDPRIAETARTLGATRLLRAAMLVSEARTNIALAVLVAFSRCVTELGIAMMVGGNIAGYTRTLATATALETTRGEFARGLAMSAILLLVAVTITMLIAWCSQEQRSYGRE